MAAQKQIAKKPASRNGGPANGKAKASQAKAAKGEVDDTSARTLKWKGADLKLPPEPPATMLFDLVLLEGEEADPLQMIRMLKSFLNWTEDDGTKHDQLVLARNLVKPDLSDVEDLFGLIMDQYGAGLGESEASPSS